MAAASAYAQNDAEAQLAEQYYNDREYDKAGKLYERLAQQAPAAELYLTRAVECRTQLKDPEGALALVNRGIKRAPQQRVFVALKGLVQVLAGKPAEAEKTWIDLVEKQLAQGEDFAAVGNFFAVNNKLDWAARTYLRGRKVLRFDGVFAPELANVYTRQNNYGGATTELLNVYYQNPGQRNAVKNAILRLTGKTANPAIERALLQAAQKLESDPGLREITYEFYLQAENYDEALLHAKAIDRLLKENGQRVFLLAQTLQNNRQYDLSNRALDYLIDDKKNSPYYFLALNMRARNLEIKALETRPLDSAIVRQAVQNYDLLLARFGRQPHFKDAILRKANLLVFYLNDLPAALQELQTIEAFALPAVQRAEAQLLIGDIYLMQGEYNKAKVKYAQVEDNLKDAQEGAMAKFRNARLAYFKGDFEMAKARLGTLKDNPQDDIANDAIRLFLLIQDNTGLDSNTTALQLFAQAQLLTYQKRFDAAVPMLDSLLYRYPNHPLTDEILWEKANIWLQKGEPLQAVPLLDRILEKYAGDVLADDALFTKAELYQYELKDPAKAQELYLKLLEEYPASLFQVEARKRIRLLRGEKM